MDISLIYARSTNYCIGKAGGLAWHLPDESRFFNEITRGKPVIMGRLTYEDHTSLLPGRMNIVVSRTPGYAVVAGVNRAASLADALELAAMQAREAFVIGGVRLFVEAMPGATRVYETIVDATIEGDSYLPRFDFDMWKSTHLHRHEADQRHEYGYTIFLHERPASAR